MRRGRNAMTLRFFIAPVVIFGLLTAGCSSADPNSFQVFRDGEKQSYDETTIRVRVRDSQLFLSAWNTHDPIPGAVDDESSDALSITFDQHSLEQLAADEDYPIAGVASWKDVMWVVSWSDVTFAPGAIHTAAVQHAFFMHDCRGCVMDESIGAQSLRGTMRFTANSGGHFAGLIELRVEGDVPGTDNSHQYYELKLAFDQWYQTYPPDAGTDAGGDADAGTHTDAGVQPCRFALSDYCEGADCPSWGTAVVEAEEVGAQGEDFCWVEAGECGDLRYILTTIGLGGVFKFFDDTGALVAVEVFDDTPSYCNDTSFNQWYGDRPDCERERTLNFCKGAGVMYCASVAECGTLSDAECLSRYDDPACWGRWDSYVYCFSRDGTCESCAERLLGWDECTNP